MAAGVFNGAVRDTGDVLGQSHCAGGGSRIISNEIEGWNKRRRSSYKRWCCDK